MSTLKIVGFAVAVTAVIAYFAYKPIPCFDSFPLDVRMTLHAFQGIQSVGSVLEKLGIVSYLQMMRTLTSANSAKAEVTDKLDIIDTQFDGIPVRAYIPAKRQSNGAGLMYIHGGGWIFGSIHTVDFLVSVMAEQLNLVAISVEYRLAPESPYPAAIDDVERAFRYLVKHAADYDIDASRIAVAGDSAGGNLAAALTIRLRDLAAATNNESNDAVSFQPKLQILLYPALQLTNISTVSVLRFDEVSILRRSEVIRSYLMYALGLDYNNATLRSLSEQYLEQACFRLKYSHIERVFLDKENRDMRQRILSASDRAFLSTYSKDARGRELLNPTCTITDRTLDELHSRFENSFKPDFSPLYTSSLEGLPTAYIVTCGYDVIRDDGLLYVERLRDAGVRVEHSHQQNQCHGYYSILPERSIVPLRDFLSKTPLL